MKKARRIVLLFVGALFAVVAVVLLALNLYVQSGGTQARIESELSRRLGTTLRIQRISVTPWWGLKLTGITMPQSDAKLAGDFLKADTFRLRVRLLSLFTGRLVIKEVALVSPKVTWAQNADGKWRLPGLNRELQAQDTTQQETAAAASEMATPAEPAVAAAPSEPESEAAEAESTFTPEVRRVSLTNGSFYFLDAKGRPVANFDGVDFRSSFRRTPELRGTATIKKVAIRDRFFLHDLRSPLRYGADELELSELSANAAGGEITGKFHMLQTEAQSPFVAEVAFRELQVDRIVSEAGGRAGILHGQIEGHLRAAGRTADPNALEGTGEIYLRGGEVRRYSLLVALGQLLQLEELSQLRLDEAHVKYHITPGVVSIDELLLTSPNIRLSATGTVAFNGKLRLASQLAINDKVRAQLFQPVRNSFQALPDQPEYSAVNFEVTGTLDNPKTDLMGKLIGPELRDLRGLIGTFLGGGKEERKKAEKREPAEPAAPTKNAEQPDPPRQP